MNKIIIVFFIAFFPVNTFLSHKENFKEKINLTKEIDMNDKLKEKNKEIVRKLYEDCLNKRDFQVLNKLIAKEYKGVGNKTGPDGFKETVGSIIYAFPDIKWQIEDLIGENEKVVVRTSWQGTHQNTFRGFIKPTNKRVKDNAITIYQIKENKIVQAWAQTDRLGFLQQLDLIPEDITALSESAEN